MGTRTHRPAIRAVTASALLGLGMLATLLVAPGAAHHDSGPRCELDLGFVLDRSDSMGGGRLDLLQTAASETISALNGRDLSGARAFPASALDKSLDADHAATQDMVDLLSLGLGDDMAGAIADVQADILAAARPTRRPIMVVISDGHVPDPATEAAAAKAAGIEVYAVAVGDGADTALMKSIASTPGYPHFQVADNDLLAELAGYRIINSLRDCGPTVDFGWAPTPACPGEIITFTDLSFGHGSVGIAEATWSFGDGATEHITAWYKAITVEHAYVAPGTYDVTLELIDDGDRVGTITHPVEVRDCTGGTAPHLDIDCRRGDAPGLVLVRASIRGFTDPVNQTWDLGDGTIAFGPVDNHTYADERLYITRLVVQDADGRAFEATRPCSALLRHPPVLAPIDDVVVHVGEEVHFRVVASDEDGDELAYRLERRGGLPYNAHFDQRSFTWTPEEGQEGRYGPLLFVVTDGLYEDTGTAWIEVLPGASSERGVAVSDGDADGAADGTDNCPAVDNPDQADTDGDGRGDACDPVPSSPSVPTPPPTTSQAPPPPPPVDLPDSDGDGIPDADDLCPGVQDPVRADRDRDGVGDACDVDLDGDGVPQLHADGTPWDVCPYHADPDQADADGDGIGDACEADPDLDGVLTRLDVCPRIQDPGQADRDHDGIGDACDPLPWPRAPAPEPIPIAEVQDTPAPWALLAIALPLLRRRR